MGWSENISSCGALGLVLARIGLGHHVTTFIEQGIDGLELDQEILEELAVTSAAERLKIKVQGGAGGMKYCIRLTQMLNIVFTRCCSDTYNKVR